MTTLSATLALTLTAAAIAATAVIAAAGAILVHYHDLNNDRHG